MYILAANMCFLLGCICHGMDATCWLCNQQSQWQQQQIWKHNLKPNNTSNATAATHSTEQGKQHESNIGNATSCGEHVTEAFLIITQDDESRNVVSKTTKKQWKAIVAISMQIARMSRKMTAKEHRKEGLLLV